MGGVLQALWCWLKQRNEAAAIADLTDVHVVLDESTRTTPDTARTAIYDEAYARYLAFNDALAPTWR